jgi:prepilin-type N-terminal cleavage/methylation domain-containing protein
MNDIKRTFTLVELLVTIAIIAILASLLFPSLASKWGWERCDVFWTIMKNMVTGLAYVSDLTVLLLLREWTLDWLQLRGAVQIRFMSEFPVRLFRHWLSRMKFFLRDKKSWRDIFMPSATGAGRRFCNEHSLPANFCASSEAIANNPRDKGDSVLECRVRLQTGGSGKFLKKSLQSVLILKCLGRPSIRISLWL